MAAAAFCRGQTVGLGKMDEQAVKMRSPKAGEPRVALLQMGEESAESQARPGQARHGMKAVKHTAYHHPLTNIGSSLLVSSLWECCRNLEPVAAESSLPAHPRAPSGCAE